MDKAVVDGKLARLPIAAGIGDDPGKVLVRWLRSGGA
jgi:hypothetical protein